MKNGSDASVPELESEDQSRQDRHIFIRVPRDKVVDENSEYLAIDMGSPKGIILMVMQAVSHPDTGIHMESRTE